MRTVLTTICWGLFCTTSWTWCIGMYLPKIMIDRFGWAGFLAFAVPNVIGCAGFGYIIRTQKRSQELIGRHREAMIRFSYATIAFHAFFLCYLTRFFDLDPVMERIIGVALPVFVIFAAMVMAGVRSRIVLAATSIVWIGGAGLLLLYGADPLLKVSWSGSIESSNLIFLAPILCFGFLLCPYFDLTFHHAFQQSPSRHSFAVFGVAFALMLLLTVAIWFTPDPGRWWPLAMVYIIVQSLVTVLLHVRGLDRQKESVATSGNIETRHAMLGAAAIGIALAMILKFVDDSQSTGEAFYLRFLVFYGLIFPSYAIAFMIPGAVKVNKRNIVIFGCVVLAAMPFYEMGFIYEQMWAFAVPLGAAALWIMVTLARKKTHGTNPVGLE